jgi:hypothetical protein
MADRQQSNQSVWPEYLMLRDTALHDDLGGAGQRIYTTAGQGYEKRKYVRVDIAERVGVSKAQLEQTARAFKQLCNHYVWLMESGRQRILTLGGECDPVDVMERGDPYLRQAREALDKFEKVIGGTENG